MQYINELILSVKNLRITDGSEKAFSYMSCNLCFPVLVQDLLV